MRRGLCVLIALILAAACGPKRIDPAIAASRLAAESRHVADERLSEGCYDCLLEAKARYEKLAVGTDRPALLVRLFETEILLTLREKELAIDHGGSLARARAIAKELPSGSGVDAARYLAIVEAVPPDVAGLAVSRELNWRRDYQATLSRLDAEIAWLVTDASLQLPVRQYLSLALDCIDSGRRRPGQTTAQRFYEGLPADVVPLVSYRVGVCDARQSDRLEAVRALVPRYAEAAYVLGKQQVARAQETGGPGARQLLAESYARFPLSRSVTYLSGNFEQLVGDCKAALRFYDETLALERDHDNALLGRTVCLAYLERLDEAIGAATDIITIKPATTLAYGFYWRAWVHHHLKRLEPARADIEQAKAITGANDILRLAGMIEYDQDQLDIAEKDLSAAKRALGGRTDCTSRWYLGLVEIRRERWSESAVHFEDAMLCYEANVILAEDGLRKMQAATNVDADFKARQIAGFQSVIKEATSQQYASAFNAANQFARAAELGRARRLLEIAAKDPELQSRVAELRKLIGGFLSQ